MSWEIQIPHQDRSQTIGEAIRAHVDSELVGEERDVAFQLDPPSGVETVGDLIDHVESLDSEGRRRLLDKARGAAGLETTGAVDAERALALANSGTSSRLKGCAAPGCTAWPTDEVGLLTEVPDRVWWCESHRDQAGPDDHLPPEPKYVLDLATMSEVAIGAEAERLRAEEEQRSKMLQERDKAKRQDAERVRQLAEARQAEAASSALDPYIGYRDAE